MNETGMPEVQAGYFFRVKRWNYNQSKCSLTVQLRRRLRFLGSVKMSDSISEHNSDAIYRAAVYCIERAADAMRKHETIHERDQFVGDYPPKVLNREDV